MNNLKTDTMTNSRMLILFHQGFMVLLLLFFILLPAENIYAANDKLIVMVLGKKDSKKQPQLIKKLQQNLIDLDITIVSNTLDEFIQSRKSIDDYQLIISIGSNITNILNENGIPQPIIAVFIPSNSYKKAYYDNNKISALFIDQPMSRYISLIKNITPDSKSISLLYSERSQVFYEDLMRASENSGLLIHAEKIKQQDDIYYALEHILHDSDVLLSIPDPFIYNRRTIKPIFLESYQSGVPIIGFSASYTRAGAISSLHSNLDNIAHQLADNISYFFKHGKLLKESYPDNFNISINKKVANSLGIKFDDKDAISEKIKKQLSSND